MNQLFTLLFFVPLFSFGQQTYVPDDNFEQALINQGYDNLLDDSVLTANISELTALTIIGIGISNLTGIEDFSALEIVSFNYNSVSELDLSGNPELGVLSFHHNSISNLDISNNPNLTIVNCYNNLLTSIDISVNPNLVVLQCENNNLLSLNLQNGTNTLSSGLFTEGNPNLECILVDDSLWSSENCLNIDPQQYFSNNCESIGIGEIQNKQYIFPSPTSELLYFSEQMEFVTLYDIRGVYIQSYRKPMSINVSTLRNGIYYIRGTTIKGLHMNRRFIKTDNYY